MTETAQPEVLEAVQWTKDGFSERPTWLADALKGACETGGPGDRHLVMRVNDLINGAPWIQNVNPGDWVVRTVGGAVGVFSDAAIRAHYNLVPEPEEQSVRDMLEGRI